jgi:hypothetical protein
VCFSFDGFSRLFFGRFFFGFFLSCVTRSHAVFSFCFPWFFPSVFLSFYLRGCRCGK